MGYRIVVFLCISGISEFERERIGYSNNGIRWASSALKWKISPKISKWKRTFKQEM